MRQSALTREQFVQQEIELARSKVMATEDLDTDVLDAIQKRAEWNAQAAERAGVTWHQEQDQEPEDDPKWPAGRRVLWSVPAKDGFSAFRILADGAVQYSWAETEHGWFDLRGTKYGESIHPAMQELARVLVAEHQAKQQVAKSQVPDTLDACCPFCGSGEVELHSSLGPSTGSGRVLLCMCCLNCQARGPAVRESVESMDSAKWRYDDIEKAGLLWRTRTRVPVSGKVNGSSQEVEPQVPDALTMDIIERLNQHFNRLETQKTAIDRLREQIRNTERTAEQLVLSDGVQEQSIAQLEEDQKSLVVLVNVHDGRLAEIDRRLDAVDRSIHRLSAASIRDRANQKTAEEDLNKKIETIGANLQGLMDSIGNASDVHNLLVAVDVLQADRLRIDERLDKIAADLKGHRGQDQGGDKGTQEPQE